MVIKLNSFNILALSLTHTVLFSMVALYSCCSRNVWTLSGGVLAQWLTRKMKNGKSCRKGCRPLLYTLKNKGYLLASMVLWRTLNIHGTFCAKKHKCNFWKGENASNLLLRSIKTLQYRFPLQNHLYLGSRQIKPLQIRAVCITCRVWN